MGSREDPEVAEYLLGQRRNLALSKALVAQYASRSFLKPSSLRLEGKNVEWRQEWDWKMASEIPVPQTVCG